MTHRDIASDFLRRFCAGDIDALAPLLSSDLEFIGPLHQFDSSNA